MNENIKINYILPRKGYHVLLGLHKSGTTWVNSYIHKKYRKIGMTMPPNNRYTELFGNNDDDYFYNVSIQDRIKFLEHCRSLNLEVNIKHHLPEVMEIWPWFKEFYKDNDVLVLKRRNLYKHILSHQFHFSLKQYLPSYENGTGLMALRLEKVKENQRGLDTLKSSILKYNAQFKFNEYHFESFCRSIRFIEEEIMPTMKPQALWVEDLTHEWLCERFNVEMKKPQVLPYNLKYELYFPKDELDKLKAATQDILDKEFKYYGYK